MKQIHTRKNTRIFTAIFMSILMILSMTGCGGEKTGDGESKSTKNVEALKEVNEIPEDGIITKEQFKTVAGEKKTITFTGNTDNGISYTWTYDASKIQNPQDQNLKIDFTEEGLDDIKTKANNANDAMKMTMYGEGVISMPILTVTLPKAWESNEGVLLKEQGGKLARMSDVMIETSEEDDTTTLTMNVTSLDGDCYLAGGIVNKQNKGADAANGGNGPSGNGGQGIQPGEAGSNDQKDSQDEDVANDVKNDNSAPTCTISISCATILDNINNLTEGKEEFVPADGMILAPSTIEFEEGETVHDILKRVCKEAGIHMESNYTPAYDSAYVEGINQLYEFDCGELSGWMYQVNGWFPNYGCSKYTVSDGDVINWVYTCDLGKDVGDNSLH